jgi:hypothetical protein
MRTPRINLYDICTPPRDDLPVVVVRQSFTLWAFLFHGGWLLYHRAWWPAVSVLALMALTAIIAQHYPQQETTLIVAQLFLQLYVGFSGADFRLQALQRQGYRHADIIAANSAEEAELRYYQHHRIHTPHTTPLSYA